MPNENEEQGESILNEETAPSQESIDNHAEDMKQKAIEACQQPQTDEVPAHRASQLHAPYPTKPAVQHQNEQLTNETPTGYKPQEVAKPVIQDESQNEKTEGIPVE